MDRILRSYHIERINLIKSQTWRHGSIYNIEDESFKHRKFCHTCQLECDMKKCRFISVARIKRHWLHRLLSLLKLYGSSIDNEISGLICSRWISVSVYLYRIRYIFNLISKCFYFSTFITIRKISSNYIYWEKYQMQRKIKTCFSFQDNYLSFLNFICSGQVK